MSKKIQLLLILLTVMIFSCESPNDEEILPSSPDLSQPIATGIYITGEVDPTPLGVWGNPADGSYITDPDNSILPADSGIVAERANIRQRISGVRPGPNSVDYLKIPYPNPFLGSCRINFTLPAASYITLYVVRARWVDDNNNDMTSLAGALTASPQRTANVVLAQRRFEAGSYSCIWNGNPFPSGFYRIYLRIKNNYYWHDVLLFHDTAELPADLRNVYIWQYY